MLNNYLAQDLKREETIIKITIIVAIIEIIEIAETIEIKIVNALEIIAQDTMIEAKIDTITKEIRISSVDHRTMIKSVNKIEGKKEKIEIQEIRKKKNTDNYEIYIIIRFLLL